MPRPPKPIDMDQLEALMQYKPSKDEAAAFFKVSADTIERRIREHCNLTYLEFRDQAMVHTQVTLAQKALEMAKKGDRTMLIVCLKEYNGWLKENKSPVVINNNAQAISTNIPPEQMDARIAELLRKLEAPEPREVVEIEAKPEEKE